MPLRVGGSANPHGEGATAGLDQVIPLAEQQEAAVRRQLQRRTVLRTPEAGGKLQTRWP